MLFGTYHHAKMYRILQASAALLATLPSVIAGTCYAVGYVNTNTAGGGIGGGAVSTVMGIQLYDPDNRQIAWWQPRLNSDDPSVCGDFVAVETGNLTQVFEWGATCAPGFTYDSPHDLIFTFVLFPSFVNAH